MAAVSQLPSLELEVGAGQLPPCLADSDRLLSQGSPCTQTTRHAVTLPQNVYLEPFCPRDRRRHFASPTRRDPRVRPTPSLGPALYSNFPLPRPLHGVPPITATRRRKLLQVPAIIPPSRARLQVLQEKVPLAENACAHVGYLAVDVGQALPRQLRRPRLSRQWQSGPLVSAAAHWAPDTFWVSRGRFALSVDFSLHSPPPPPNRYESWYELIKG